jgi:hypothetical protein
MPTPEPEPISHFNDTDDRTDDFPGEMTVCTTELGTDDTVAENPAQNEVQEAEPSAFGNSQEPRQEIFGGIMEQNIVGGKRERQQES